MGPAHTTTHDSDLSKIVRDQRKHIAHLELQLRAHECRASQLQERLLVTLDTLDATQLAHTQELMAEQREKEKLAHTVHVYAQSLRSVEAERDDLRDAVAQLVEKVDLCNDFSLWPHTALHQTSLAADHVAGDRAPRARVPPADADALAYASSLIASLRAECDAERTAHARTAAEGKAQVAQLQASIARREAELEARISDPKCPTCALLQAGRWGTGAGGSPRAATKRMSREEAIRVLEQSSARNHRLTVEVDTLISKVGALLRVLSRLAVP
ncbi:hypothetical protein DENSPDRAFT_910193 [Dentipellis sp. KUC8613]|nr:hypothetical protein DENSPDRAFT_910193 [Dentipellis sp. KUC8613]